MIESALTKISDGLYIINDFIPRADCKSLFEKLSETDKWEPAKVYTNGKFTTIDEVRKQSCISLKACDGFLHDFLKSIPSKSDDYLSLFNMSNLDVDLLAYQRSVVGDFFKWHKDSSADLKRKISVLYYLNDGFGGGETEFIINSESVKIIPCAGDALIFDSNIVHRGNIVTDGTKFTILCIYK